MSRQMILLLVMGLLLSCNNQEPINTGNPSNLSVEVIISSDGSGYTEILATADNAIEYRLYIDMESEPVITNTSGQFEYTFAKTGSHQIEVRAYGSSGRYLKEIRHIEIGSSDIPLDHGYITPIQYDEYSLIWNDEFEGNNVDTQNWIFEIGDGCPNCGWGNNEWEYYRRENAWVENNVLIIEARKENYRGKNYTSARMITNNLQSFQYGRIDIRALLPKGQGIWPALWMLGENISSIGWPACGEIDIMEMIGGSGREKTVHGTVHWDHNGEHAQSGGSRSVSVGSLADRYHVFSIIWDESSITWYLDDIAYYTINITQASMSEFHQKFFFIFNVAVGGNWPGYPDATTIFPQRMQVDYVRVFQKN